MGALIHEANTHHAHPVRVGAPVPRCFVCGHRCEGSVHTGLCPEHACYATDENLYYKWVREMAVADPFFVPPPLALPVHEESETSLDHHVRQLRRAWNGWAAQYNWALSEPIEGSAKKRAVTLLKDEWWRKNYPRGLVKATFSPFLCGKVPGRDGQPRFHFSLRIHFLQHDFLARILEGRYSREAKDGVYTRDNTPEIPF